eukprot:1095725-Prorocentrum_minimum.AAC.2
MFQLTTQSTSGSLLDNVFRRKGAACGDNYWKLLECRNYAGRSEKVERDLIQAMLDIKSGNGPHAAEMAETIEQNSNTNEQRAKYSMWLFDEVRDSRQTICILHAM